MSEHTHHLKSSGKGYGLYIWQSSKSKKYHPGELIRFNKTLAKLNEHIIDQTYIQVECSGLYRITWSLNSVQQECKDQPIISAIGRALINGCPLGESYSYQLLTQKSKNRSYDALKGKHALKLHAGDRVSLEITPESRSVKLVADQAKQIVGGWIEVEKVS